MKDAQDTKNQSVGGTTMFHGEPGRSVTRIDESDTVTRYVPRVVRLTLPDHTQRVFQPGLQEIPRELAYHQWMRDNGVVEYEGRGPLPPPMLRALPGTQAHAASIMQSGVYDVSLIRDPVVTDAHVRATETMARQAAENLRVARENVENAERISVAANTALADARQRLANQPPIVGGSANDNLESVQSDKLRDDGPTVQDFVKAGYSARNYPPKGFASKSSADEINVLVAAEDLTVKDRTARADKLKKKDRADYDNLTTDNDRDAFLDGAGV